MSEFTGAVEQTAVKWRLLILCPISPSFVPSSMCPFLPQSCSLFAVNCPPFFFLCSYTERCLFALCDGKITSAFIQLSRLVMQPDISLETRFKGQYIADELAEMKRSWLGFKCETWEIVLCRLLWTFKLINACTIMFCRSWDEDFGNGSFVSMFLNHWLLCCGWLV